MINSCHIRILLRYNRNLNQSKHRRIRTLKYRQGSGRLLHNCLKALHYSHVLKKTQLFMIRNSTINAGEMPIKTLEVSD